MKFWDFFKAPAQNERKSLSRLHDKIEALFPEKNKNGDEEEIVILACEAGLLARVAYCDFDLSDDEKKQIKTHLQNFAGLSLQEAQAVADLAIEEIKDLAGLENQKYAHPLIDLLDNDRRYQLVMALFAIAASGGEVSEKESEEIRQITTSLNLEHKHFIAARATVKEKLGVLNS